MRSDDSIADQPGGDVTARVRAHLHAYLEQESPSALRSAAELCRTSAVDVGAVLEWIHMQPADAALTARAALEVRRAVGLPLRSGGVCSTPR